MTATVTRILEILADRPGVQESELAMAVFGNAEQGLVEVQAACESMMGSGEIERRGGTDGAEYTYHLPESHWRA